MSRNRLHNGYSTLRNGNPKNTSHRYNNGHLPSKKSRKGLWITLAVTFIIICSFLSLSAIASTSSSTSPSTAAPVTPTMASGSAKIGQTITVDGVSCKLVSVKKVLDLDNLEVEWVIVDVKIVNNTDQDYQYSLSDFNIISGTGNATGSSDTIPSTYNGTQIVT
jgi:hypothetical protein